MAEGLRRRQVHGEDKGALPREFNKPWSAEEIVTVGELHSAGIGNYPVMTAKDDTRVGTGC